jgi:hypothetical protein
VIGTLNRYVDWLSDGYLVPAKGLAVVRILFALQLLVFLPDPSWISRAPDAFWSPPPGPFQHLDGPPSDLVIAVLHWTVVALAVAVLVGLKTGPTSVALTVGLVTLNGFAYSFGKVDHFILHAIFPAVMAAAGWGRAWSVDARGGRHRAASGFPMLIWAIILAYSFLSASVPKLLSGWLDPSREATRGYVAVTAEDGQRKGPLTDRLSRIDSHVFWKALDYATVFAEGWLILAVLVPVLFRIGVAALPVFHLGVFLSLRFDFSRYLLVEAVMLVPWFLAAAGWLRSRSSDPP